MALIKLVYRNHAGRVAERAIEPINIWFGVSEYHPKEPAQWFLRADDVDKDAKRDFALKDILDWTQQESDE